MPAVQLKGLSKTYPGGVRAASEVTCTAEEGEFLVLVGPSGSGKTTTLRLIAGLDTPDSGSVHIGSRDVTRLPPHQRDVAFVFQRPALYPTRTVRDNLALGITLRRPRPPWSEVETRVREAAEMLHLGDLLHRLPTQLSGGQQQRVALGRALVRRPAVFLLDEPLSQLDVPLRLEMRRDLHLLQRRLAATMIYVTHDQEEALGLADRIAVLDEGRVVQVDRPEVLLQCPSCWAVAAAVGWPPVNRLDGRLEQVGPELCLTQAGTRLQVPGELTPFTGQSVRLAVRPEAIRLGAGECWEVRRVEPFGPGWLTTLARGSWEVTAWQEAAPASPGAVIGAGLDWAHAHLFDGTTGQALWHGGQGTPVG